MHVMEWQKTMKRRNVQTEDKKYDETILYRQKEDLYAIYEDQKLFEEANPSIKRENQPHRRHSKADESSNASADSQIVQMKFDNLNINMRSSEEDSDNDDAISMNIFYSIHTYSVIIIAIYFTATHI